MNSSASTIANSQAQNPPLRGFWIACINSPRLSLLGITLLAAMLRLLFLSKSLWEAEGESIAIVHGNQVAGSWPAFWSVLWAREFNMALYYVLLRLWLHLGNSESFIRLLSVIPGVATIVVLYLVAERLFGRKIALVAALLLAIHGSAIAYSQEARSYSLLILLCTASYLFFVRAIESGSRKDWLLYTVISSMAVYAHFFAFLIFPAQVASLLWLPRNEVPWKRLCASAIGICVLTSPALVFILTRNVGQLSEIHSTWGRVPNLISTFAGTGAATPIYLVLWGFAVAGCFRRRMFLCASKQSWRCALLLNWLALPTVITLLACLAKPVLETRYLLFCVSASVVVAAWGLFEIQGQWRLRTAVITLILSLVGVAYVYAKPKDNWRGASEYVLSHAQRGDVVTVVPPASRWTFDYYLNRHPAPGLVYSFPEGNEVNSWLQDASREGGRIWIIYHDKGRLPSAAAANSRYEQLHAALNSQYHLQTRTHFNMGVVEVYVPGSDR